MVEFIAPSLNGKRKQIYNKLGRTLPFGLDGEHTIRSESLRLKKTASNTDASDIDLHIITDTGDVLLLDSGEAINANV